MNNKVQLITYIDRLGKGDIAALHQLISTTFSSLELGALHLLPFFYPIDGADAGYDPQDNRTVDQRLGSWADIHQMAQEVPLMADLIVNHISDDSKEFKDVLANGEASEYYDLFLTKEKVFHGKASDELLDQISRPMPSRPFSSRKLGDGSEHDFWTTFSEHQLDIDVHSNNGKAYLLSVLQKFALNGISAVRLDAIGYAVKKAGTSCFMIPETYQFIKEMVAEAHVLNMEVLAEVHAHPDTIKQVAELTDYVYDFAMPPLVLQALLFQDLKPLKAWLLERPHNVVTVLDTHDGIGIMDVAEQEGKPGMLSQAQLDAIVEAIHQQSKGQSKLASGAAASNLDAYQINCTFYDALGADNSRYMMARAIQLMSPGIPQIYYAGLLALSNDMDLLAQTKVGRDINRPYVDNEEILAAAEKPLVQALFELIQLRNTHIAFQGDFSLLASEKNILKLRWMHGSHFIKLLADVESGECRMSYTADDYTVKKRNYGAI